MNHLHLITHRSGTAKTRPLCLLAGLLLTCLISTVFARGSQLIPPDDPRQSIAFWKAHTISAQQDPLVKQAHDVFSVLLRSWDSSRLEPDLYIVDSTAGAWAASLADGNILMSRHTIDVCMKYGERRGEHLLAFVLAHELAHQRADDLWHLRFFRMVGSQTPQAQARILRGLSLDREQLQQLEQKEAQADHDGLILMSSVGYDPHQVIDKIDFFTEWVESIWQSSCHEVDDSSLQNACHQAKRRALRSKLQLDTVAAQAMLYEMGVQAYIAKQYSEARHYFTAYGRDYPGRAIISALATTYMAEAAELQRKLLKQGDISQADFYYPLLLDASVAARHTQPPTERRGSPDHGAKQKKQLAQLITQAIKLLERAITLEPDHRQSYLMLANAYFLSANSYMVRGVIQGRYIPRFKADTSSDLFLAMTQAIEGKQSDASKAFQTLLRTLLNGQFNSPLPENLLIFTAFYNSAAHHQFNADDDTARANWQLLAERSKATGNSLLFRLALDQLRPGVSTQPHLLSVAPVVDGYRLGDQMPVATAAQLSSELWIEGEKYSVLRNQQGSRFILSNDNRIIRAWQKDKGSLKGLLSIGDSADRPLKSLGLPSRQLHMMSGDYLAYDQYGLALHINQNRIQGWFLY